MVNSTTTLVSTVIGGCYGYSGDGGDATSACLSYTDSIWIDTNANFFLSQSDFYRIRKVASNIITRFAGNGYLAYDGDGGPALDSQLNSPLGTFVDTSGNVYIVDEGNCHVRLVDVAGIISTIGGTDNCEQGGDNLPFSETSLENPTGIWKDTVGNLFITDTSKVLKVAAANNIVTSVAGGGLSTAENVLATSYYFDYAWGIWGDTGNNLFITDYNQHKVKRLSLTSSLIVTAAGSGVAGFADNVPAINGRLCNPTWMWVDTKGRLFISDESNHRIRKVENGIITTFAGTGTGGFNGNGHLATATMFYLPSGVTGDSNGNVYVADTYNCRIRMIYPVNSTANIVKTVIGSGLDTVDRGIHLAAAASHSYPQHVTLDTNRDFYITEDSIANTVRKTILLSAPTSQPSRQPTGQPSRQPVAHPTAQPSRPTHQPTADPSSQPVICRLRSLRINRQTFLPVVLLIYLLVSPQSVPALSQVFSRLAFPQLYHRFTQAVIPLLVHRHSQVQGPPVVPREFLR
jgi:hypothetical protein